MIKSVKAWLILFAISAILAAMAACTSSTPAPDAQPTLPAPQTASGLQRQLVLRLPQLEAAKLAGEPLKVVATTSIIGDVVGQVGGDAIVLTTMMAPGQDPHSFEPTVQDLAAVSAAQVIFVNGWDLEEGLVETLKTIGVGIPLVAVSANIEPLALAGHEAGHDGADPHAWMSIDNVKQWVANIEQVFSSLDPANAAMYATNATGYLRELDELESYTKTQLDAIPADRRFLITNHDSLGYFAHDYDFEILGTVIPGASTLSEPSAKDMVGLVQIMNEHALCTIFTETTVSDTLAQTVADELSGCDEVRVLQLYTGSLGPPGSGADSYIGMFRANVDVIAEGLQ